VTGYPVDSVRDAANLAFIAAYRARFSEAPKMGSVVGHALISSIVAGILKAGGTETEILCDALPGTSFETPFGRARWRGIDHQSTLGTYVGRTALKGGKGTMVDWWYVDGAAALPGDDVVRGLRAG
jgi:branched-chain amino acid transport system substrate-binding protein